MRQYQLHCGKFASTDLHWLISILQRSHYEGPAPTKQEAQLTAKISLEAIYIDKKVEQIQPSNVAQTSNRRKNKGENAVDKIIYRCESNNSWFENSPCISHIFGKVNFHLLCKFPIDEFHKRKYSAVTYSTKLVPVLDPRLPGWCSV